jgi:5-(carboxyamino)imidazole ribonucleotide mutase
MGSKSDWQTMRYAAELVQQFDVPVLKKVVSAHRTPELLAEFAKTAEADDIRVIIAGAGGAAHLPGMLAAYTHLPVLAVPVESRVLHGIDSLLSIVQMPAGIPVMTLAIGEAGAKNAALGAISILALTNPTLRERLIEFRRRQTEDVLRTELD